MSQQTQLARELHRPARRHFPTRPVEIKGLHESWQADLCEMGDIKRWNKNFKYILMVIDTFSKKVFARALKTKDGVTVANAMRHIIKKAGVSPENLQTDAGKEFFNKHFRQVMNDYHINHYHSHSDKKASIVERVNRTIKTKLYRLFTEKNTLNWVDNLQSIVVEYNKTPHRTIRMAPNKVNKKNTKQVLRNILKSRKTYSNRQTFHKGDIVRLSRFKKTFDKGYKQNWTEELFQVEEILPSNPRVYKVTDLLGDPVEGTFYAQEMKTTKIPSYARIEKIIARKILPNGTKMMKVRWSGYDSRFDQWLPASQTTRL